MSSASEERLGRMLAEGKITPEQYAQLLAALRETPSGGDEARIETIERTPRPPINDPGDRTGVHRDNIAKRPLAATVCAWFMIVGTVLDLATRVGSPAPQNFIAYALQILLAWGLFRMWPMAYVGTAILMSCNFVMIIQWMIRQGGFALPFLLYIVFLALLFSTWKAYFGPDPMSRLAEFFKRHPFSATGRAAPWPVRALALYLLMMTGVNLLLGLVFYPSAVSIAQDLNQTLHEVTFGPFAAMTPWEGISAAMVCFGLALGLIYRVRWVWILALVIAVGSAGDELLSLAKNGHPGSANVFEIVTDLLATGLLLYASGWFFTPADNREEHRLPVAPG
jgi:hypothetical protein